MSIRLHRIIENTFFSVYFFIAMFTPNFPFSTRKFLFFFNILLILWCALISRQMKIPWKILKMVLVFLPFVIFFLLMQCFHLLSNSAKVSIYISSGILELWTLTYIVVLLFSTFMICVRYDIDLNRYLSLMMCAGILQLLCVILSLVFPSIRNAFIEITLRYSRSDILSNAFNVMGSRRGYGFSSNLFDSLGYIIAMLITFTLILGIETKKKTIVLLSFVMLIIPAVNARTGLVLSFLGFLIVLCFYFNVKHIKTYLLSLLILLPLTAFAYQHFIADESKDWVMNGLQETVNLSHGEVTGVYSQILDEDIVFPSTLYNVILGSGASPENLKNYVGIDSGYIQYLWRFGIIGAVLLLTAQFLLFYIAWRSTKKRQAKCILATFPFMILTYLFKLYSWGNFGAAFICFSLPVVIIVDAQKQERRLALSLLGGREWTIRK